MRTFARTALLYLGAIIFTNLPALAQSTRGAFTLPHEVHWQSCVVPAGDYRFSIETRGPSQLLILHENGGDHNFLLMSNSTRKISASDVSRLTLVSRQGQSAGA
jgi:hypothetical protein